MRVSSDGAIARHAFKPSSNRSLKSQNRVLGGCHAEPVEAWCGGGMTHILSEPGPTNHGLDKESPTTFIFPLIAIFDYLKLKL